MKFQTILVVVGLMALAGGRHANAAPVNMMADSDFARPEVWTLSNNEYGQIEIFDVQSAPFEYKKAARVTVKTIVDNRPFLVKASQKLAAAVKEGENLTVKVWLRSPESAKATVRLEQTEAPFDRSFSENLTLTPEWQEFKFIGKVAHDYGAQQAAVILNFAFMPGTVEFTGLRVLAERAVTPSTPDGAAGPTVPRPDPPSAPAATPKPVVAATPAPNKVVAPPTPAPTPRATPTPAPTPTPPPAPPADTRQNLIAAPDFSQPDPSWFLPNRAEVRSTVVEAQGVPYPKAVRFDINVAPGTPAHLVWAAYNLNHALKRGDPVSLKLWLRSPGNNPLTLGLEQASRPYDASFRQVLTLTPTWTEYELQGTVKDDYAPLGARIFFRLTGASGTIEMTGVRFLVPAPAGGAPTTPGTAAPGGTPPVTPPLGAAAPRPALNVPNLLRNGDFAQGAANWDGATDSERSKASFINAQAGPYGRALLVVATPRVQDKPWTVSLRQAIDAPLKKGDKLALRLWLRSPDAGKIGVIVEQGKAPFGKVIDKQLRLTTQWAEYEVRGEVPANFAPGEARLSLYLSYEPLTLEIAGVQLAKVP